MDIYNSTYHFSKLVQKFGSPPVSETKQSTAVGRRYLTDGEHSGETDYTNMTYSQSRID